jgi:hypothetical protein
MSTKNAVCGILRAIPKPFDDFGARGSCPAPTPERWPDRVGRGGGGFDWVDAWLFARL